MNRHLLPCVILLAVAGSSSAWAQGLLITEIMPDTPATPDWFELTNTGTVTLSISGYRMDDNSFSVANSLPLMGISSLAAGESVVFLETNVDDFATKIQDFRTYWGGRALTMQIGYYAGAGVSLAKTGDGVIIFSSAALGSEVTRQSFSSSTEHISQRYTTGTPQVQSQSTVGDGITYQSVGTAPSSTDPVARRDTGSPGFAAVPEPTSLTLAALGGVLLGRRSRRRR